MKNLNACPDFDLAPLLLWATHHKKFLEGMTHTPSYQSSVACPHLLHTEFITLSRPDIAHALKLFPDPARKRSTLRHICGKPAAWYSPSSTLETHILCHEKEKAVCSTAFVDGMTEIIKWNSSKLQDIFLFKIPLVSKQTARHIQLRALIREYARTIVRPLSHPADEEYVLNMSDHFHVDGFVFLNQFAETASAFSPISQTTEKYWPLPKVTSPNFSAYVSEEFCETIAAFVLGWVFCQDTKRWWNPFVDRMPVKMLTEDFLNAHLTPHLKSHVQEKHVSKKHHRM